MNRLLRPLVCLLLMACSEETTTTEGPIDPWVLILTQPADLTSDTGDSPVRVILQPWARGRVTTALIQEVTEMISAESNGRALMLDIELEIDNATDSLNPEADATYPTSLLIRPRETEWPDSWVDLRIGPLSSSLKAIHVRTVDNHVVTRFCTGSRPIIRGIELCPKPDQTLRFMVHFSESVGDEEAERYLLVSQEGASCQVLAQPVDTSSVTYDCHGFALDIEFSFAMLAGMRAASGLQVAAYDGSDSVRMSGVYNDLQPTEEGCRGAAF